VGAELTSALACGTCGVPSSWTATGSGGVGAGAAGAVAARPPGTGALEDARYEDAQFAIPLASQ